MDMKDLILGYFDIGILRYSYLNIQYHDSDLKPALIFLKGSKSTNHNSFFAPKTRAIEVNILQMSLFGFDSNNIIVS